MEDRRLLSITLSLTTSVASFSEIDGAEAATGIVTRDPVSAEPLTVYLTSSDLTEATVPTEVTIPANQGSATFKIDAVDDVIMDGTQTVTIEASAPGAVSDSKNIDVTDDDIAGITVDPTSGLTTTEAGGTASFTVKLDTEPEADVTIDLSSSNTDEGTISHTSLTFTAGNWNTPQEVTVTGVDDFVADGDVEFMIETAAAVSADANYDKLDPANVSVTNQDDDSAGITVDPISDLTTTETGETAFFTVRLDTEPVADVTINLSSSDTSEGTVLPASLIFTADNWDTPQTVTVTGVDDLIADDDVAYAIGTTAVSDDETYDGMKGEDVSVTNQDNDVAGITVFPTSDLTTTEAGGTVTFTVQLDTQPMANVTIGLLSSDATEGIVLLTNLTFEAGNWNTPKMVTVYGKDDSVVDGDVGYTIVTTAASADVHYHGMEVADVSVTNQDDDVVGITVTQASGLTTTEAGGTATFTVRLDTQPEADVTIGLSSSDTSEGTVFPSSLTFTADNWDAQQTVTVTGVDDSVVDGDVEYTIVTAAAVSADANYDGMNAADAPVANTDNDVQMLVVSTTEADVPEGGTAQFTVKLNAEPESDVVVTIARESGDSDLSAAPTSLTFTPSDWNVQQTVTVDAAQDPDTSNGTATFTVSATGLPDQTVTATEQDDDFVTPIVNIATPAAISEGDSGTKDLVFTVSLSEPTTRTVTVHYATSDGTATAGTDYTPIGGTVTFNVGEASKEIHVPILGDDAFEGDETFAVTLSGATNATIDTSTATGTILNDDENQAPSVEMATPSGTESGDVTFTYWLTDDESDPCGILVEYSLDDGATWSVATAGAGGDGTTDLTSDPDGTAEHTYVWDSGADLVNATADVKVRMTPDDAYGAGDAGVSGVFTVDNYVETAFQLIGPASGAYYVNDTIDIQWTAGGVVPTSRISLCYDTDAQFSGNETWIEIDAVTATTGDGAFAWDTAGVAPGTYYLAGYMWDGDAGFVFSHLATPITIHPPTFHVAMPTPSGYEMGQTVNIPWTAHGVVPSGKISFCYDVDTRWNGNEHWIEIDGVAASNNGGAFAWDTAGVAPGTYYLAGYMWDGGRGFYHSHLATPIQIHTQAPATFNVNMPTPTAYAVGQTVNIPWTAGGVGAASKISLCYDTDAVWDWNEHWIEIDGVPAANGDGTFAWDTTGVAPGTYYLAGYMWDGGAGFVFSHLNTAITLTGAAPATFNVTMPTPTTYEAGQTVNIPWTAGGVGAASKISLCYDTDAVWDWNEHWIEIDAVAAANGDGTFAWDTTGVAPGTYYLAGYMWDGAAGFVFSHLSTAITITGAPPQAFALDGPATGSYPAGIALDIAWTADNVEPDSKISLCYDTDAQWNNNEYWIEIDEVAAADGSHSYAWDTTAVTPGDYYVAGYLWNGDNTFTFSHLNTPITITAAEALTLGTAPIQPSSAGVLTTEELGPIVAEARLRLAETFGPQVSAALADVSFEIADLAGGLLGETSGKTIYIDKDAAGHGWFVDPTPQRDEEFSELLSSTSLRAAQSPAARRADLLTTVMHEMGHEIGLGHNPTEDWMNAVLPLSTRRLPGPRSE